jgi:hypothetical protein
MFLTHDNSGKGRSHPLYSSTSLSCRASSRCPASSDCSARSALAMTTHREEGSRTAIESSHEIQDDLRAVLTSLARQKHERNLEESNAR